MFHLLNVWLCKEMLHVRDKRNHHLGVTILVHCSSVEDFSIHIWLISLVS